MKCRKTQYSKAIAPAWAQAFCGHCGMCTSGKTNLCGSVRAWTGRGVMRGDDKPRFTHKESGKEIFHFVRGPRLSRMHCR